MKTTTVDKHQTVCIACGNEAMKWELYHSPQDYYVLVCGECYDKLVQKVGPDPVNDEFSAYVGMVLERYGL